MRRFLLIVVLFVGFLRLNAQATTDSIGVYAITDNSIEAVDPITYTSMKVKPGFMSAKAKLEFAGKTSPHHFKDVAKFRVFFGQPSPYEAAKLYMFTPAYSMKDFGIGEFEVKKNKRQLNTTKVSAFTGVDSGAKEAKDVEMEVAEVRPGVYDVTVTGKPGEYCIMHIYKGSAGYGSVFDFTIE